MTRTKEETIEFFNKYLEDMKDPIKRKKMREEHEKQEAEKRHKIWLEKTRCECGEQMKECGSWRIGEIVFGGSTEYKSLYQCPICKNIKIV